MFGFAKAVALCAILAASAHATEWNALVEDAVLVERALVAGGQDGGDQSFRAPETTKQGNNCTEAFGSGYETCRPASDTQIRLCYNPSIGQICCEKQWGCPTNSFCLVKDYCCPNGIDPQTCATKFGVTLPSAASAPKPTVHSSSGYSSEAPTTTPAAVHVQSECPAPVKPTTTTTEVPAQPVKYPVKGDTTLHYGYGYARGTGTASAHFGTGTNGASSTYPPFNNAGSSMKVLGGGSLGMLGLGLSCVAAAMLCLF